MGRVLTNSTSFRYAIEATEDVGSRGIGFLPGQTDDAGVAISGAPVWKDIEPNDIGSFGSNISTVSRNPIRKSRGRQKGTISGLTSGFEYDADVTVDSFLDHIEGFMFAKFNNFDLVFRGANATVTANTYTVPALNASQAARLQSDANFDTLLYATGYAVAANNGLKVLSTAAADTNTTLTVAQTLASETAPANARLEIAGIRMAANEVDLSIAAAVADVSGRIGTLTFNTVDPSTIGLAIHQIIYVVMTSVIKGFARVTAIDGAGGTITLDRMDATLVDDDGSTGTVDLRYGQQLRDVASDDSRFLQRSVQIEAEYPGLASDGTSSEYEYARGNFCSTITMSMDLEDKATLSASFVGTDTDVPTATRKVVSSVSPANALAPLGTEAFSTVADFARLRVEDVDEDGLTTDFKTMELGIDNNVGPEVVLNNLGAKFINFGNFFVDMSCQVIFSSGTVLSRIRENTTVALDMFLRNNDGVIAFSVPSMTLGDGTKDLPVDETVLLNISGEAFEDNVTGASLDVSFIPSVP